MIGTGGLGGTRGVGWTARRGQWFNGELPELVDFPIQNGDFPIKNGDFPSLLWFIMVNHS